MPKRNKKLSVRQHTADELSYLLDHFTIEQLTDLGAAVSRSKALPKSKDKSALIKNLRRSAPVERLALAAHRLEILIPFKHCYLYRYRMNGGPPSFEALATSFASKIGNLLDNYLPVDLSNRDLQLQCALIDNSRRRIHVKFCHPVSHFEWVDISDNRRERLNFRQRHPVVFSLYTDETTATIAFPRLQSRIRHAGCREDCIQVYFRGYYHPPK